MTKAIRPLGPALALLLAGPAPAADWKPADAPLMTRWGKQVTPENAWTQYPRPQLVRHHDDSGDMAVRAHVHPHLA